VLSSEEIAMIRRVGVARDLAVVVLFGSVATGRDSAHSDLDLAILAPDAQPIPLRRLGELKLDFERELGRTVDVLDLASADTIVRYEVLTDGQVLRSDPREAWTALAARTLIEHDDIAFYLPSLIAGVGRAARSHT
jgi:predicted nucleotidyltransferase